MAASVRNLGHGVITRRALWLVAMICGLPVTAFADLTLRTLIESSVDSAQAEIVTITYIKGAWLRRESHGEGLLADLLGTPIVIANRSTGETFRLYPDTKRFAIDTSAQPVCDIAPAVDWRLLGRVRSGVRAHLEAPDTTLTIDGCRARLVRIEVAARYGGVTSLDIWVCPEYQTLFGREGASDLLCGDSLPGEDEQIRLAMRLQRQFGLSEEEGRLLAFQLNGYPLRIESVSRQAGSVSQTRFLLADWELEALPDSLFRPPADYTRSD